MFKAVAETGATTDRRDTEADGLATHGDATAAPWDIPRTRSFFEGEDSLTLAEAVDCPVLVVHARDDEIVPPSHSLTLVHHLRPEALLLVLEGGTHTTAQHSPWVHQYTAGWLKRTARLQPVLRLPVAE
jgi:pimeloyl-ACP methyl ester carboxylesterase